MTNHLSRFGLSPDTDSPVDPTKLSYTPDTEKSKKKKPTIVNMCGVDIPPVTVNNFRNPFPLGLGRFITPAIQCLAPGSSHRGENRLNHNISARSRSCSIYEDALSCEASARGGKDLVDIEERVLIETLLPDDLTESSDTDVSACVAVAKGQDSKSTRRNPKNAVSNGNSSANEASVNISSANEFSITNPSSANVSTTDSRVIFQERKASEPILLASAQKMSEESARKNKFVQLSDGTIIRHLVPSDQTDKIVGIGNRSKSGNGIVGDNYTRTGIRVRSPVAKQCLKHQHKSKLQGILTEVNQLELESTRIGMRNPFFTKGRSQSNRSNRSTGLNSNPSSRSVSQQRGDSNSRSVSNRPTPKKKQYMRGPSVKAGLGESDHEKRQIQNKKQKSQSENSVTLSTSLSQHNIALQPASMYANFYTSDKAPPGRNKTPPGKNKTLRKWLDTSLNATIQMEPPPEPCPSPERSPSPKATLSNKLSEGKTINGLVTGTSAHQHLQIVQPRLATLVNFRQNKQTTLPATMVAPTMMVYGQLKRSVSPGSTATNLDGSRKSLQGSTKETLTHTLTIGDIPGPQPSSAAAQTIPSPRAPYANSLPNSRPVSRLASSRPASRLNSRPTSTTRMMSTDGQVKQNQVKTEQVNTTTPKTPTLLAGNLLGVSNLIHVTRSRSVPVLQSERSSNTGTHVPVQGGSLLSQGLVPPEVRAPQLTPQILKNPLETRDRIISELKGEVASLTEDNQRYKETFRMQQQSGDRMLQQLREKDRKIAELEAIIAEKDSQIGCLTHKIVLLTDRDDAWKWLLRGGTDGQFERDSGNPNSADDVRIIQNYIKGLNKEIKLVKSGAVADLAKLQKSRAITRENTKKDLGRWGATGKAVRNVARANLKSAMLDAKFSILPDTTKAACELKSSVLTENRAVDLVERRAADLAEKRRAVASLEPRMAGFSENRSEFGVMTAIGNAKTPTLPNAANENVVLNTALNTNRPSIHSTMTMVGNSRDRLSKHSETNLVPNAVAKTGHPVPHMRNKAAQPPPRVKDNKPIAYVGRPIKGQVDTKTGTNESVPTGIKSVPTSYVARLITPTENGANKENILAALHAAQSKLEAESQGVHQKLNVMQANPFHGNGITNALNGSHSARNILGPSALGNVLGPSAVGDTLGPSAVANPMQPMIKVQPNTAITKIQNNAITVPTNATTCKMPTNTTSSYTNVFAPTNRQGINRNHHIR